MRQAEAVVLDVADESRVIGVVENAKESFGSISGLVNSAGTQHISSRFTEMSGKRFREAFEVNVVGAMICAREAVRHMSTASGGNGGSIVNVSSRASGLGSANEFIDYAASKGAIDTFTIGLANEVAEQGIRVNAVKPGLIYTDIHKSGGVPDRVDKFSHLIPMQRGGQPSEVAEAIAFLLSDRAKLTEGTQLILLETPDSIVLLTQNQLRDRVRRELISLDLVADLLAERRQAAKNEDTA